MVNLQCSAHRGLFAHKAFVRKARAAPHDGFGPGVEQRTQHTRRRGGVANAHFPGGDQLYALTCQPLHQPDACQNALGRLLAAHGWAQRAIFGAVCDAAVQNARLARIVFHAHIHGQHRAARHLPHAAHSRYPQGQIVRHGGCYAGGALRNALGHHAVVGAEHQRPPGRELYIFAARKPGDLLDGLFQKAQTAQGLGTGIPVFSGFLCSGGAGRGDARQKAAECLFCRHGSCSLHWIAAQAKRRASCGLPAKYKCGKPAYRLSLTKPQRQLLPLTGFSAHSAVPLWVESQ